MKQLVTRGIILSRTDFGEADRIITLLTPDHGKLRLLAKGVRKIKSRLAGGVELFSVSDITYIAGRGEIGTLISARLDTHYGTIIQNIDRVQLGYELIKLLNKITEDSPEVEYFSLLEAAFAGLDNPKINLDLIRFWLISQCLKQAGYTPNLLTDVTDQPLEVSKHYSFDFSAMSFAEQPSGGITAAHIKSLRLLFSDNDLLTLAHVQGLAATLPGIAPLIHAMRTGYLRV